MATKPYQMMTCTIHESETGGTWWDVELGLLDTATISAQKERLTIWTRISPPFPDHPQPMELAALLHVRDLLTAQIEAMQSL
jgi:hypothetical protein